MSIFPGSQASATSQLLAHIRSQHHKDQAIDSSLSTVTNSLHKQKPHSETCRISDTTIINKIGTLGIYIEFTPTWTPLYSGHSGDYVKTPWVATSSSRERGPGGLICFFPELIILGRLLVGYQKQFWVDGLPQFSHPQDIATPSSTEKIGVSVFYAVLWRHS